ncbi:MAG: LamG domain-containing protein [Candidatus Omnitrophota bacterium]|jgi:hypothetical protein
MFNKVFKILVIVVFPVTLFIVFGNINLKRDSYPFSVELLSSAYVIWNMDDNNPESLSDVTGKYSATPIKVKIVKGRFKKARYFNGKYSYVLTPINFKDWEAVTISMWVKPQQKSKKDLAVIIDNGHDANSNFVLQSIDAEDVNSDRWVWHCNGADISFKLPFNEWSHIVALADGKNGIIAAYVNGLCVGRTVVKSFEFNGTNLTIGKLSGENKRYFKGAIDEVVIFNRAIVKE